MANMEHLKILMQGAEVWNKWRRESKVLPDLTRHGITTEGIINLVGVDFQGMDLGNTILAGADMRQSRITSANLENADLSDVNLSYADLRLSNLFHVSLRGANLSNAKIPHTNFYGVDLEGADLTRATAVHTSFDNIDLGVVQGLESIEHGGPSTVGLDTLSKSGGQIPEAFLRGCGLTDWEIENAKLYDPNLSNEEITDIQYRVHQLLAQQPIQIKPLFISYSHSDTAFVDHIENYLNRKGIRYWRDIHHATSGKLEKQIDRAISLNDIVLLVLSEHSTNSDWVEHEARKAREKECKSGKDALCPVALDDSWKTCRWPERLREQIEEYNVLDFSRWQDQAQFDRMFAKLIEGLGIFYK